MLAPNQTLLLHDYFTRSKDLWLLCEKYDCDHDQMMQIIGAITPHLPGKGLDYSAILSNDPIACDHLVLHCQRSIGQLDDLYDRLISLFDSSSTHEIHINKRTTVNTPPDWAKPSFSDGEFHWDTTKGSEKVETTTLENKQRFRILESAMKCLERGLKMQITLTQRKEKLRKGELRNQQEARTPQTPAKKHSRESLQETTPFSAISGLSGMQPYQGMTGYNLNELHDQEPVSRDATRSAPPQNNAETTNNLSHSETGTPGWLYPTTRAATPQEASEQSRQHDNTLSQPESPREEEPVTLPLSASSAPPRETTPKSNPFAKFGPPREFAYPPHIAELMPNRYPWRKELKEIYAARKASLLPLSANSAPQRETTFTSPDEEAPAYHQRE